MTTIDSSTRQAAFGQVDPFQDALDIPLHWRRPRLIFVNSMSDLFHSDVPEEYIALVFDVMQRTPQHTYQILTKRAQRLASLATRLKWPENVWMGVSVETERYAWRIDYLRRVPVAVRFVSAEPLLAPLLDKMWCRSDWRIHQVPRT